MTTIPQLPTVTAVGPSDLLPVSQNGVLFSASVSQVTAGLQQSLVLPTGDVLGRSSAGAGAPEPLALGAGIAMSGTSLAANGLDHLSFAQQPTLAAGDELIVNAVGEPTRVPASAIIGLFTPGSGIALDSAGTISVIPSAIAGPAGPAGPTGPAGPAGPVGATGPQGAGLAVPGAANAASMIGESDYVAIWQNGANSWITYKQLIAGQTIEQLPSAGPAGDSDLLLVAQGGSALASQSFSAIWAYITNKLPTLLTQIVEITSDTVLDSTTHNRRVLVASNPVTLTANFVNMGSGFSCRVINLSSGAITMGTGITAGNGVTILPPGGSAVLDGITYSGGSLVWWDGAVSMTPILTVAPIPAQLAGVGFTVTGGVFNDAPIALDYSVDGVNWVAAPAPTFGVHSYSFSIPGLAAGVYRISVRDHADQGVVGVSASFNVAAPSVTLGAVPGTAMVGTAFTVTGTVFPAGDGVSVGLSSSATTAPASLVPATVNAGNWTVAITPSAPGTYYVWAQQTTDVTAQAVSTAITVTSNVAVSYTINQPSSLAYTIGSGPIALNGSVSPAQVIGTQVALSTSGTTAPTSGWSVATIIDNNAVWAVYLPGPTVAGTYYIWVETTAGEAPAVSSFTIAAS
ncbi:MAG: collagen-like protein [Acidiphilium sp.]